MGTRWKQFYLGDICTAQGSSNNLIKGKQIKDYKSGLYPAFSATGQDIWREEYEHEGAAIIVSAVGARCGKCFRADGKWTAIANTHIIFPKANISRDYLFYQINNENFWEKGGVAQPFVKIKDTLRRKSISFPVDEHGNPDLVEQKRIVAILEEAETLKKKRAEADKKMNELIPALFIQMFGDPIDNSKNWTTEKFAKNIKIGTRLVDPKKEEFKLLPQIGGENIVEKTGELINIESAQEKQVISSNYIFTDAHILYSKIRPYLNKVAFPGFSGICSADIYPLISINENINSWFLLWLLRTDAFVLYASGLSQRLRMPKLNREQLGNYQMIVPPIKLQNQFAEKVKEIETQKGRQKQSAIQLDSLFSALHEQVFCRNV